MMKESLTKPCGQAYSTAVPLSRNRRIRSRLLYAAIPPEMISNIRRSWSKSILRPRLVALSGTNMLPPEDKGDSDRDQRRRDEPYRDEQDRQMAGTLDGYRQTALVLGARSRLTTRANLPPVRQVTSQEINIFVRHFLDLIEAEIADFAAAWPKTAHTAGASPATTSATMP